MWNELGVGQYTSCGMSSVLELFGEVNDFRNLHTVHIRCVVYNVYDVYHEHNAQYTRTCEMGEISKVD